jgi:2-iminobutanoate/2-iminopropanoate deaminase
MKPIHTQSAPKAVGPYSQAIVSGDFVFCSGQIGIDPKTQELASGIEAQTHQVLKNLKAVLEASGSDYSQVVKTTIFVTDIADFSLVNDIYAGYFENHKPARATVEVSRLPKGAVVEIEAIATLNKN